MLQIIIFQAISGWQIIYQLTYTTWGFHWWANWTPSLPVYLHGITHWPAPHCLMLLKPRLATKQQWSCSCTYSYFQKKRMCCIQAFHKFVTVYCHGTKILTTEGSLAVPLPSPASQETLRFKAFKTVLAKAQGIFRLNATFQFWSILNLSRLPRLGWTLHNQTIQRLTNAQNCVSWPYTEIADSSQEPWISCNAWDKIGVRLCFVLFHCPSSHKKTHSFFPSTFPSLLQQLTAFMH